MKKLLLTSLSLLFVSLAYSQSTFITTEGAAIITISTEEIQTNSQTYSTLMVINHELTMLTHTVDGMTSTYYIRGKEFKTNDRGQKLLYLYVVSDVGNSYTMICNKEEKIWFTVNQKQDYSWIYNIKAIWQE